MYMQIKKKKQISLHFLANYEQLENCLQITIYSKQFHRS